MNEIYFLLQNKNIVITGASSGIGRQCAITCSQMGANVIMIALEEDKLNETMALLQVGKNLSYVCDITKFEDIDSVISDAVSKNGKISGYIHSAGIEMTLPLNVLKPDNYAKTFAVNVISAFEISKRISHKKNCHEDGASFVFISSIMSDFGQAGKIAYCSSKGALVAGARAMALELTSKKIRVNCISPGMVRTEMSQKLLDSISEEAQNEIVKMHPLGIGQPSDVANGCVFLLSDASKWITGINLYIDGGYGAK
jgi:NAD(P)-dependent dehydrogenase (short-subunit alcohol dehydrogenase family)